MQNEERINVLENRSRTMSNFLNSCVIIVAFIIATSTFAHNPDNKEIILKDGSVWRCTIGEKVTIEYKEDIERKD